MAIKTCAVGSVKISGNSVSYLSDAALAINIGNQEVTSIGDSWRKVMAMQKSWTLTGTFKYDSTDTAHAAMRTEFISGDGALASVHMYEDATHYFTGSGYLTQFNMTKSVGNVDTIAFTIEGNGTLGYS